MRRDNANEMSQLLQNASYLNKTMNPNRKPVKILKPPNYNLYSMKLFLFKLIFIHCVSLLQNALLSKLESATETSIVESSDKYPCLLKATECIESQKKWSPI